ncbi:hypothetical protein BH23BAC3_BH23BAC3_22990 [soil metagenome]
MFINSSTELSDIKRDLFLAFQFNYSKWVNTNESGSFDNNRTLKV